MTADVQRDRHVRPDITLENCEAIKLQFEPDGLTEVVCWRGLPSIVVPAPDKRIRDLRAGDIVHVDRQREVVMAVLVYR